MILCASALAQLIGAKSSLNPIDNYRVRWHTSHRIPQPVSCDDIESRDGDWIFR
jgi:hypothetical protein